MRSVTQDNLCDGGNRDYPDRAVEFGLSIIARGYGLRSRLRERIQSQMPISPSAIPSSAIHWFSVMESR